MINGQHTTKASNFNWLMERAHSYMYMHTLCGYKFEIISTNLDISTVKVVSKQMNCREVSNFVKFEYELDVSIWKRVVFPANPAITWK